MPIKQEQEIERKKQLILETSVKLIVREKGLLPTKILAHQAGLSEGTVFRYFENKENLLKEVLEYLLEDFRNYFKNAGLSWREEESCFIDLNLPLRQRFRILWDVYLDWGMQHFWAFRALQLLGGGAESLKLFLEKQFRRFIYLQRPVSVQKHDKKLPEDQPNFYLNFAIHLFISLATTTLEIAQEMSDKISVRQLREMSFAIFFSGLSSSPLAFEEGK